MNVKFGNSFFFFKDSVVVIIFGEDSFDIRIIWNALLRESINEYEYLFLYIDL